MNSTTETLSFGDLKHGWSKDPVDKARVCIFCGMRFEKGRLYGQDGNYFDAKTAVKIHLGEKHGGVFESLLQLGQDASGLSEVQEKVIRGLFNGKSDIEIAESLGDKALSTVRAHRRNLRIKAGQARVFLAVMNMLEGRLSDGRKFIDYGPAMPVRDDRIDVTQDEASEIEAKYFRPDGSLVRIPQKEKHKLVTLRRIALLFEKGVRYSDAQVRSLLQGVNEDHALLRRCLVDYHFIVRNAEGSIYERE